MFSRKATLEDVKDISRIYALSWKAAYQGIVPQPYLDQLEEDFWVPAFQTWMENHTLSANLVFDGSTPVGCAAYGQSRDEKWPDWGEIVSLYVLPDYWSKGYGRKLFESALCDLKNSGYQTIYLWVLKENERARKFYERMNFQCTYEECTCRIMDKTLVDIRYINQEVG